MNNERFLRLLNSGIQADFNQLWKELVKYTVSQAIDLAIYRSNEAAHKALNEIEDLIVRGKPPESWGLAQIIIDRNLIDFKRADKIKSVADYELSGVKREGIPGHGRTVRDEKASIDETIVDFKVYKVADKHGFPKDRILELPESVERDICTWYWNDGLEQSEIVAKLKANNQKGNKSYVSRVIKDHRKS